MFYKIGYVFKRMTLRKFVEISLRNTSLCPELLVDKYSEDLTVPKCLGRLNIFAGDSRDPLARERFFIYRPESHFFNETSDWYWTRKYYVKEDGLNCCSNYTISFHYISGGNMYTMYFLTYHLKPYGIKYRYPPLPKKYKFSEVARTLEMERITRYRRRKW